MYLEMIRKQGVDQMFWTEETRQEVLESIGDHTAYCRSQMNMIEEKMEMEEHLLCQSYKFLFDAKNEYENAELEQDIIREALETIQSKEIKDEAELNEMKIVHEETLLKSKEATAAYNEQLMETNKVHHQLFANLLPPILEELEKLKSSNIDFLQNVISKCIIDKNEKVLNIIKSSNENEMKMSSHSRDKCDKSSLSR